jgi:hypothetical protein
MSLIARRFFRQATGHGSRSFAFAAIALLLELASASVVEAEPRRLGMAFEGQMHSAVEELQKKMAADPELRGRKLKLGKFTGSDSLPDSRFEQRFERTFRSLAAPMLDDASDLVVSGSYDFVEGTATENAGLKVVQFTLAVKNAQRRSLQQVVREINDTGDIARIVGISVAPPDTPDVVRRNEAVRRAEEKPGFVLRDRSRVQATGNADYAVEILACRAGEPPRPVVPRDVNGRAWIDLALGTTFEIALFNFTMRADAVAEVSIDGLDVVNEFCEDEKGVGGKSYDGYVVPRGGVVATVPGWLRTARKAQDNVLSFVVNEYGMGAATARQTRGTRGVINVQFFEAVPEGDALPRATHGREVGAGRPIDVNHEIKRMTRRDVPIVNITIHYNEAF